MRRYLKFYIESYRHFSLAIWLDVSAVFVNSAGMMLSFFIALYLVKNRHYEISQMSLVLTAGGVGGILGSYVGGWLADRFERVSLMQLSLMLCALSSFLLTHVQGWILMSGLIFFLNFWIYAFRPANTLVLFSHCEPSDQTRVFGLFRTATNLGFACAVTMGGMLAERSFDLFFYFSAFMSLFACLVLTIWKARLVTPCTDSSKLARPSWNSISKHAAFLWLAVLFFASNIVFAQLRSTYGLFLSQQDGLDINQIGHLFIINTLSIAFLEVPVMTALKKIEPLYLAMIGCLLIGAGMSILPLGLSFGTPVWSVILWTLGEILSTSPFYVLAARYSDPRYAGLYMGVFQGAMSLGVIFAPLVGGDYTRIGTVMYYGFHAGY